MSRVRRDERGSTLVTVALSMVLLMAFLALAVDVGLAYAERRKAQNAADAAALAGAAVLPGGNDAEIYALIQEYTVTLNGAHGFEAYYLDAAGEVIGQVGGGDKPADARALRVVATGLAASMFGLWDGDVIGTSSVAEGGYAPLDVVLVIDCSGSMNYSADVEGESMTRLQAAQAAARAFIKLNDPALSHIAVVSYANDASLNQALTDDYDALNRAIDGLISGENTNIADGLDVARAELTGSRGRSDAARVILLLTDGRANYGTSPGCHDMDFCGTSDGEDAPCAPCGRADALAAADTCSQSRVAVFTIAFGSDANGDLMREIAQDTGGEYYSALTPDELIQVYQDAFERIRLRLLR